MKPPRSLATALVALAALAFTGRGAPPRPGGSRSRPAARASPSRRRRSTSSPIYPQEALAQGVRGIVILELVLDAQGKVESTTVIRSVPGLDEAAIAAARQWEYEPTKVDGKPVRVRLTVPITFALALPAARRGRPGSPSCGRGPPRPGRPAPRAAGGAVAEVTLEPDGRVGVARILEGDAPVVGGRSWPHCGPGASRRLRRTRCSPSGSRPSSWPPAARTLPRRVILKATGLQRSGLLGEPAPASAARPLPQPPHRRPPHRRPPHRRPPHRRPPHRRPPHRRPPGAATGARHTGARHAGARHAGARHAGACPRRRRQPTPPRAPSPP